MFKSLFCLALVFYLGTALLPAQTLLWQTKPAYLINTVTSNIFHYKDGYYILGANRNLKAIHLNNEGSILWSDSIGKAKSSSDYQYYARHIEVRSDTIIANALTGNDFINTSYTARYTLEGKFIDSSVNTQIPETDPLSLSNRPRFLSLSDHNIIYYGVMPYSQSTQKYGKVYFYKYRGITNDTIWRSLFDYNDTLYTIINMAIEYSPATILAVGNAYRYQYNDMLQNFLLFIDSSGRLRKTVPLSEPFYPTQMIKEDDGTITMTGFQQTKTANIYYVARMDTNGTILRKEQVTKEPRSGLVKILKTQDGGYVVGGSVFVSDTSGRHLIYRLDKDYKTLWKYSEDTLVKYPAFVDLIPSGNSRYVFLGQCGSVSAIRTPPLVVVGEIRDDYISNVEVPPSTQQEVQCLPSPAGDEVYVHVSGVYGNTHIEIVTIQGERVESLSLNAEGSIEQHIDVSGLAQGVYRVLVYNNQRVLSTSLTIVR